MDKTQEIETFEKKLFKPFAEFLKTEQASGIILICCTLLSLALTNSSIGEAYKHFWEQKVGFVGFGSEFKLSIELWINDALMAIFFLVVGIEIKRELISGELSSVKQATLPMIAALGGMIVPAIIYYAFNYSDPTTNHGWGIPMATDIAFALGVLSLVGKKIPISLKVFLTALAVVDDLGAIVVIAVAYTKSIDVNSLIASFSIFGVLILLNRLRFQSLFVYIMLGIVMWAFMLKSGIHATISGVLLAMTIPMASPYSNVSPAEFLGHSLHQFSSFIIMPLFALANTCIVFDTPLADIYSSNIGIGIILGLFLGKPIGIAGASLLAIKLGLAELPRHATLRKVIGVGLLGGIGFTMSIFVSLLAFDSFELQSYAKIAVLTGSLVSGLCGYFLIYTTPLMPSLREAHFAEEREEEEKEKNNHN